MPCLAQSNGQGVNSQEVGEKDDEEVILDIC